MAIPIPAGARNRIDRLLDRRRARFRRALVLLLGEHGRGATRSELAAAIHDLCVRELAGRIRIVRHELAQSRVAPPGLPARELFDAIRAEVTGYLTDETTDLAGDEQIALRLAARKRGFLRGLLAP